MNDLQFVITGPWAARDAVGQVLIHRTDGDCYLITSAHGDRACTSLGVDFSLQELANPKSSAGKAWGVRYNGTIAPACHFGVVGTPALR